MTLHGVSITRRQRSCCCCISTQTSMTASVPSAKPHKTLFLLFVIAVAAVFFSSSPPPTPAPPAAVVAVGSIPRTRTPHLLVVPSTAAAAGVSGVPPPSFVAAAAFPSPCNRQRSAQAFHRPRAWGERRSAPDRSPESEARSIPHAHTVPSEPPVMSTLLPSRRAQGITAAALMTTPGPWASGTTDTDRRCTGSWATIAQLRPALTRTHPVPAGPASPAAVPAAIHASACTRPSWSASAEASNETPPVGRSPACDREKRRTDPSAPPLQAEARGGSTVVGCIRPHATIIPFRAAVVHQYQKIT